MESIKFRFILIGILILLALPIINAEVKTATQGSSWDIIHAIRVAGAPTNTALCNITVADPDNNILVNFKPMTNTTQFYNYTLPASNTSKLGLYNYDITCLQSGLNATNSFSFEVTPTGKTFSTAQSIIYIFALIFGLVLFLLVLYGAIAIPYNNNRNEEGMVIKVNDLKYAKIFLWFMSYMILIFIAYLGWNISFGFLNFGANFFYFIFWVLISGLLPIIVMFSIVSIINLVNDKRLKDGISNGFNLK